LSRKNSPLHEAQLNIKLLEFLEISTSFELSELPGFYGIKKPQSSKKFNHLIDPNKFNLILHPKSKGSAVEWGLDNFKELARLLPSDKFKVFVSGTSKDAESMGMFLKEIKATDITGQMNLSEFIDFIGQSDGLVAASTGPLHIAAALGKKAIGLFSSRRPIHPGRWQPLGMNAKALVYDKDCETCRSKTHCECIQKISPQAVIKELTT